MARNENPPFPRGSTFWGGDTTVINTTDAFQFEGVEYEFEDLNFSTGTIGSEAMRCNRRVRCRCVRNVSGATLYASNLVELNINNTAMLVNGVSTPPSAGQVIGQIVGIAGGGTSPTKAYPIDEWLPAAGVVNDDLCWIVVDGYATVVCSAAVNVWGIVVSDGTGKATNQDTTQTGAALYAQIQNAIGRAVTATTASGQSFVVDVNGHCR
jgi:hypothetical protein